MAKKRVDNQAIVWTILAALAMATLALSVKSNVAAIPPQVLFWSSRFFPLLTLPLLFKVLSYPRLATRRWPLHFFVCFCYLGAIGCYLSALKFISLTKASALFNAAPLYIALITSPFVKRQPPWAAVGLNIVGVLFLLSPLPLDHGTLLALLSGLLIAVAQSCNNYIAEYEPPDRNLLYLTLLAPILSLRFFLFYPKPSIHWSQALLFPLLLAGVATLVYQVARRKAAKSKQASLVMPFSHLSVIFSGIFDWLLFDDIALPTTLLGAALILAANTWIHKKFTPQIPAI